MYKKKFARREKQQKNLYFPSRKKNCNLGFA